MTILAWGHCDGYIMSVNIVSSISLAVFLFRLSILADYILDSTNARIFKVHVYFPVFQLYSVITLCILGPSQVFSCICLCFLLWAGVGCGNPVLIKHCRTSWDIGTRQLPVPLSQYRWVLTRTNSCVSTAASPPWWSFTGVIRCHVDVLQQSALFHICL